MPPGEWYCPCPVYNPRIELFILEETLKIDPGQFLILPSPFGVVVEEMIFSSLKGTNPRGWAGAKSSPELGGVCK